MRLRYKTFSLNFLLLSQLTYILAFPSINSLLHLPNILKHFTSKFIAIEVFELILRSDFSTFKIKSSCLFSINFGSAVTLALERRISVLKHVIIFFSRSWSIFSIDVLHKVFFYIKFGNF